MLSVISRTIRVEIFFLSWPVAAAVAVVAVMAAAAEPFPISACARAYLG